MYRPLLIIFFAVSIAGCNVGARFNKSLGRSYRAVQSEQGQLKRSWGESSRRLTWKKGVSLIKERNLSWQRSQKRLVELRGARDHFLWRQLNPRLLAVANINAILGELSNFSGNGLGASLLGSVNVPDPISYYARRYGLELQYYHALLGHEMLNRRLQISLYTYFLQKDEIDLAGASNEEMRDNNELAHLLNQEVRAARSGMRQRGRKESLRVSLNRLLDTPGSNWSPDTKTLPRISYASRMNKLDVSHGYGRIALMQAAGQVELAQSRLFQAKYAQVPRFSAGTSLPTIYNSNTDQAFDYTKIGLFASLSRSIDFTGRKKRDREKTKEQADQIRRTLKQRLEREMVSLGRMKRGYQMILKEERHLKKQQAWSRSHPPQGRSSLILTHLKEAEQLNRRIRQSWQQRRQLDLQFWMWDDNYWGLPF